MNTETTTWNKAIDALRGLNYHLRDCPSKHDRVDVLIAAAIELGINKRRSTISALTLCSYHSTHVLLRLSTNTGNDPIAKRWWHDEDGCYHNHPE